MSKANYLVFHPDNARERTNVHAIAMVNGQLSLNWQGDIWVDSIGVGNEDPFVFNDPWLYSYCHASQLRRNYRKDSYLQIGSKIIFVSGQYADKGYLTVDTYFLIGGIQKWIHKPKLKLPTAYNKHYKNNNSDLWCRHLKFPFAGSHKKVSHTFEAELWQEDKTIFSFLPLDNMQQRVSIPLGNFSKEIKSIIELKRNGKYPVLLTDTEINSVLTEIDKAAYTKVLRILKYKNITKTKKGGC